MPGRNHRVARDITNPDGGGKVFLHKADRPCQNLDFLRRATLCDIAGGKITIRRAGGGEEIKTLDGQDRKLTNDDLVIADESGAIAIAGVMGGFDSEIKPDTTTVVFESAMFEPSTVRLTAQRVGLRTEASSRYEKGLDYHNTVPAIERA